MQEDLIVGLDIGSTAIRIVVGQPVADDKQDSRIQILGLNEGYSEGINKGIITNLDEAVNSITACLEKTERIVGIPIESSWIAISGAHIITQASKGVVAITKVNGEIAEQDVARAVEAARMVATPPNYEILHVIPRGSIIDGQGGIKDPIGMTGSRLEVDTLLVQGLSSQIKNVTKCLYRCGLEIDDLVFSILAAAESILDQRQKELGVALVNIGGSTTSLAVFEEGELVHTAVLPIGSMHITADIAIGLRIGLDTAESIKIEYGTLDTKDLTRKEEIDLGTIDTNETGTISRKYISEIIEARVEEIFDKIDKELKKIGKSGLLPAGIVLTGGGSKLPGIVELAKKKLRLPACNGTIKRVSSTFERIFDPTFSTAVGLVFWGNLIHQRSKVRNSGGKSKASGEIQERVKKWFKGLLP